MTNSLLLNMAIEIVDLPIDSMMIFHSYVNVYQRVTIHEKMAADMILLTGAKRREWGNDLR